MVYIIILKYLHFSFKVCPVASPTPINNFQKKFAFFKNFLPFILFGNVDVFKSKYYYSFITEDN